MVVVGTVGDWRQLRNRWRGGVRVGRPLLGSGGQQKPNRHPCNNSDNGTESPGALRVEVISIASNPDDFVNGYYPVRLIDEGHFSDSDLLPTG